MSPLCKKCQGKAIWAIDLTHPGPVDVRYETYYACEQCKDKVAKIPSVGAEFRKL